MKAFLDYLAFIFMGLAVLFFLSPFALHWFIHQDSERYAWIISGPPPFHQFGSGTFQLWMYVGLLVLGFVSLLLGLLIKRYNNRR